MVNYKMRSGIGIDIHKLSNKKAMIIGGVNIPYHLGIDGHSDGDVLLHAIVDALLGSLALGDIGTHFPSNDIQWKDANSQLFLEHAFSLIQKKGYSVINVDSVIMLQKPSIAPHILEMRKNISQILSIDLDQISVKATTTDSLGYIGKGEGIAASAVVLISNGN